MESGNIIMAIEDHHIVEIERIQIPVGVDRVMLGADQIGRDQKSVLDIADIAL